MWRVLPALGGSTSPSNSAWQPCPRGPWLTAQAPQVDWAGPLCSVQDWSIVDATTVTVRDALYAEFPGTGNSLAIKVHKVLSVRCGAPMRYHFRPAREHDSRHLISDESWRGYSLLADLAYAGLELRRACHAHRVRFVIRLNDNWKLKVDYVASGQVPPTFFPGTDLDAVLAEETRRLDGRVIEADVHVGWGSRALPLRLRGAHPQGL